MKQTGKKIKVPFRVTTDDHYHLLGIVSNDPDYKVSLLLNRELQVALRSSQAIEIAGDSGETVSYSKFTDNTNAPRLSYNMVTNRSGNNIFIKKLKSYDYLLYVQDDEEEYDPAALVRKLKETGLFRAVFQIDVKEVNVKYLQYLIP